MKKLLVVLLVLGMAAPAMAAEWNWWGHARVLFSWSQLSEERSGTGDDRINGNNGVVSIPEGGKTQMIGADIKTSDTVGGAFQIGQSSGEDTQFRSLYGYWNFGAGKLKVGHMEMPITTIYSTPITIDDGPWVVNGYMYENRHDSVQLQFGGFEVAFSKNESSNLPASAVYTNAQRVIPHLEAAYTYKTDKLNVKVGANFQTFDLDNADDSDSVTINSYALAAGMRFRPANWQIAFGGYYSVNGGNQRITGAGPHRLDFGNAFINGDDVENGNLYSIYLTGSIDITSTVGLGAGTSYMASYREIGDIESKDSLINAYFQVPITLAKGVTVTPEIGAFLYGDDQVDGQPDVEQGEQYYFSTKLMIVF